MLDHVFTGFSLFLSCFLLCVVFWGAGRGQYDVAHYFVAESLLVTSEIDPLKNVLFFNNWIYLNFCEIIVWNHIISLPANISQVPVLFDRYIL